MGMLVILLCLLLSGQHLWRRAAPRQGAMSIGASSPKRSCRIGYQRIPLYRHLFTAVARSYFADEGVEVELKPFISANQMMEGLLAGAIDATGLTNLEVAMAVEAQDPGRFALADLLVWRERSFPDYILVRASHQASRLSDLKGTRIGLHPGSAVRAFFQALLRSEGLRASTITTLEMKPELMQAALVAGRVDALYCMDPVATVLVASGEARVLMANPMRHIFPPPVPISGAALSRNFLRHHPDTARRVIRAMERAIRYIREADHERVVAEHVARYSAVPSELALKMNQSEYWTLEEVDHLRVQALADRFHELGIAAAAIDMSRLLLPAHFAAVDAPAPR